MADVMNTCSLPGAVKLTMGFDAGAISEPTQCLPIMLEYAYSEMARNPSSMLYCGIFAAVMLNLLTLLLELEAHYAMYASYDGTWFARKAPMGKQINNGMVLTNVGRSASCAGGNFHPGNGSFHAGPGGIGGIRGMSSSAASSTAYSLL